MDKLISFFIVGGQRCGTSSLSSYLKEHPDICFSQPKEPHFFAEDIPGIRVVNNYPDYLRLFSKCTGNRTVFGEGSTAYLQSSCAIKNIYEYNKNAKIIVMLRNPVDMIYSLHSHLLFRGFEDEIDFLTAWNLQQDRANGKNLPKDPRLHPCLQYKQVGSYAVHVERLLKIFPRSQIKFILFEDFAASAKSIYEETLIFLGLSSDGRRKFETVNDHKSLRFEHSTKLVRQIMPWSLRHPLQKIIRSRGCGKLFHLFLSKSGQRKKLPDEMRQMLKKEFSESIISDGEIKLIS